MLNSIFLSTLQMLMMVGLPGSGKTYWAEKQSSGEKEKKFNVLGTNNIIDKMRVGVVLIVK